MILNISLVVGWTNSKALKKFFLLILEIVGFKVRAKIIELDFRFHPNFRFLYLLHLSEALEECFIIKYILLKNIVFSKKNDEHNSSL